MEMKFKKLCGEAAGPDLANPFDVPHEHLFRHMLCSENVDSIHD